MRLRFSLLIPLALGMGCSSMPSTGDGGCPMQPPTNLIEDACRGDGGMFCYYDTPPTGLF